NYADQLERRDTGEKRYRSTSLGHLRNNRPTPAFCKLHSPAINPDCQCYHESYSNSIWRRTSLHILLEFRGWCVGHRTDHDSYIHCCRKLFPNLDSPRLCQRLRSVYPSCTSSFHSSSCCELHSQSYNP